MVGKSFAFSRPRGIKGNYQVEIVLELLPTEKAVVSARQASQMNGKKQPVWQSIKSVKCCNSTLGKQETYTLTRIVAGDTIRIDIQGSIYDPLHCLVYTATMQGFAMKRVSWYTEVHTWLAAGNDLVLVDRDNQDAVCPLVELQVLDIPHGFQMYRLVENAAACEETPQQLLAGLWALVAPQRPAKRFIGKE